MELKKFAQFIKKLEKSKDMEIPKKRFRFDPVISVIIRKPLKKRRILDMLDLNDKCILSVMKWLSLDDLYSMSRTCKQFQKLAGTQFQQICPNSCVSIELTAENRIKAQYQEKFDLYFSANIQNVTMTSYVYDRSPEPMFNYLKLNFPNMSKSMTLDRINCKSDDLGTIIQEQLDNLTSIAFNRCSIENIHQQFLKYCTNLTHLRIKEKGNTCNYGDEWKYKSYPKLNTLTYWTWDKNPCEGLKFFIPLNCNVKNVSLMGVNAIESVLVRDIDLDNLIICCETPEEFGKIATLLIHHSQFNCFKRFELVFTFNSGFDAVTTNHFQSLCQLPSFQGFHGLFPVDSKFLNDILKPSKYLRAVSLKLSLENKGLIKRLVQLLPSLECVRIYMTNSPIVFGATFRPLTLPFFAKLTNLKSVIVHFKNGSDVMHKNDIIELNKTRMRLDGACLTTIYMERDITTKFLLPVAGLVKVKPISMFTNNISNDPFLF